jgi:hypothetical protein
MSATAHNLVNEPRQIRKMASRGAPWISPRRLPTPFWPSKTLSPTRSGPANTVVPVHNVANINSIAKTNLELIYSPCGTEIIYPSLPHRAAPPWHPPYRDSPSHVSSYAALTPDLQKHIIVSLILRLLSSSVYSSVLRRIVTIAMAILHGLLDSMPP